MPVELSLDVPRTLDGPAIARSVVRSRFARELRAAELANLLLVIAELTSNAILHGTGPVRLRVDVGDDGLVRGEVIDQGSGFAHALDRRGVEDVGGRGLRIVGSLAERWGVHEGTSHVWFELSPSGDAEPVDPRLGVEERPQQLD